MADIFTYLTAAFQVFFIIYTCAVLYGLYVFIPRMSVTLVTSLPQLLANGIGDTLRGIFQSQKMRDLGELGNAAKAEKSMLIASIAETDPLKALVLPWIESAINSPDSPVPKYLRPTIEKVARDMITKAQVNFTGMAMPKVVEFVDQRLPQLRLSERLKELEQLAKVEKVES